MHFLVKKTKSVISSYPASKDGDARFTTVPFKAFIIKYKLDCNVYNFENGLFSFVVSLLK